MAISLGQGISIAALLWVAVYNKRLDLQSEAGTNVFVLGFKPSNFTETEWGSQSIILLLICIVIVARQWAAPS